MSSYFSSSGGSNPVASAAGVGLTTPTLFTATIAVINTEQSYTLPANTRWFSIVNQTIPVLKISYTSGQSGTLYREIPRGCSSEHPELDSTASITIYFQAATVGGRLEIESWK